MKRTKKFNNRVLKEDIEKLLSQELGRGSVVNCGRRAFSIDNLPSVRGYVAKQLLELLKKYMVSPDQTREQHIVLYVEGKRRVQNFVRLGDILEVESIESVEQGEIYLKYRNDLRVK